MEILLYYLCVGESKVMVNIGLARGWTKQLIEIATFFLSNPNHDSGGQIRPGFIKIRLKKIGRR